jgi:precorrin-3B synthase
VLDPVLTGDGWLLRVRLPAGVLPPGAMRAVAAVAAACGSGAVELTSRANLQVRGVTDLDGAARRLIDRGLALDDPQRDALRAVVASPLHGHDPTALVDLVDVLADVERQLVGGVVGAVPPKFGVVLDDGGSWSLDRLDADVRLAAVSRGSHRWTVTVRGGRAPLGTVAEPGQAVVAAAQLCADHGGRMDEVVRARGPRHVAAALGAVDALPGEGGPEETSRGGGGPDHGGSVGPCPPRGDWRHVGRHPDIAGDRCNVVAAPFLGRVDATTLASVAALAARYARRTGVTPERSLAFCGVQRAEADALESALADLALITRPGDRRSLVSACVGSRGCEHGRADTLAAAERLVHADEVPAPVHLSGCEKHCGLPAGVAHLVADPSGRFVAAGARP